MLRYYFGPKQLRFLQPEVFAGFFPTPGEEGVCGGMTPNTLAKGGQNWSEIKNLAAPLLVFRNRNGSARMNMLPFDVSGRSLLIGIKVKTRNPDSRPIRTLHGGVRTDRNYLEPGSDLQENI